MRGYFAHPNLSKKPVMSSLFPPDVHAPCVWGASFFGPDGVARGEENPPAVSPGV